MWYAPCVFQPVVQDALVRRVLRPAPVRPTSSATALLETACVKVEEMTVNKVQTGFPMNTGAQQSASPLSPVLTCCMCKSLLHLRGGKWMKAASVAVFDSPVWQTRPSSRGASWFLSRPARGSRGEPSAASWCSSSWWCCCWLCCCSTAAGRRTSRTTRRPCPSPPAAQSTLNTPFQVNIENWDVEFKRLKARRLLVLVFLNFGSQL